MSIIEASKQKKKKSLHKHQFVCTAPVKCNEKSYTRWSYEVILGVYKSLWNIQMFAKDFIQLGYYGSVYCPVFVFLLRVY